MRIKAVKAKINWSSLLTKEDWWAVWVGFFIILLGIAGAVVVNWVGKVNLLFWWVPKSIVPTWGFNIMTGKDLGLPLTTEHLGTVLYAFVFTLILTWIGVCGIERKLVKGYVAGYIGVFLLTYLAIFIAKNATVNAYGLEFPLWALLIGLAISNTVGVPKWLKPAVRTEFYIKIGLVILGITLLFSDLVVAGGLSAVQSIIVVLAVWYFTYYLALKAGLSKSFATIMSTGVSICGVSAAIAAGGAIKGDSKEVSYVISMVLLTSIPMLIFMPMIAMWFGWGGYIGGAWIGGTVDTTPAVVAAGAFLGEEGMKVASVVKIAQNVLIGLAAFFLAVYWVTRVERKQAEKPSPMEIWYRFPKFIVGFIIASIMMTILAGAFGAPTVKGLVNTFIDPFRSAWFFPMAFVGIGLDTRILDLLKLGGGKPAAVYVAAQLFNIGWTLLVVFVLWGGVLFPSPKL